MRALPVAVAAGLAVLVASPLEAFAAHDYGTVGTKVVEVKTLDAATRVIAPTTGGPYPLLVASHGFSASGDNQIGWAKHFASYGFVVAVPSFPSPLMPDTAANAAIIEDLVTQLRGPQAAAQKVATTGGFGIEGHSAGGLATAVAALKLAPAATVLFDPVDKDMVGKVAYGKLCTPVLAIFAGPSSCNNNADWRTFATTTTGDLLAFDVKGSTHCDGENDARSLCGPFCGGAASTDRQTIYAHYATAFFLARLAGDATAAAALADATVDADTDIAAVTHGIATCTKPPVDAGTDGGPSSSSSSSGAASSGAPPAATPPSSADPDATTSPSSGGGCGCRTTPLSFPSHALAALGLALGAMITLRRRPRSR